MKVSTGSDLFRGAVPKNGEDKKLVYVHMNPSPIFGVNP